MSEGLPVGLYEKVLANLGEGVELPPPQPPRASASVVLWRPRRGGGCEVFWVRRSMAVPFMAGWHAFPGGGLSRRDAAVEVAGGPAGVEAGPADGAMPAAVTDGVELEALLPEGLVACALRELFEETGLLPGAAAVDGEARAAARRALLGGESEFGTLVADLGMRLSSEGLVYAGRWLTPPLGPLRFDNRFFLLAWDESLGEPEILPGELASGEWVEPGEALAAWQRGEVLTAPPILHTLEVLADAGPEAGLERLRRPTEANLGEHRRIEFRPAVMLFPLPTPTLPPASHTNCYVLGREACVLVDPGTPFLPEIDRLEASLAEARERLGRRVVEVWLTHHHPDHVGGLPEMQRRLEVPVRCHPATAERLAGLDVEFGEPLEEGARIALGEGAAELVLEVLHTPGHARGHLCFFAPREGWLIGGDMVSGIGMIVIDPPEGDMSDYLESLDRLARLGATTLFPGHGPTLADPSAKFREYREHRLWREGKILEAWESGVTEPAEMLPTVYADVPRVAHPLAIRQILAHLARLESLGRIER